MWVLRLDTLYMFIRPFALMTEQLHRLKKQATWRWNQGKWERKKDVFIMNNPISFLFAFCIKGMQSHIWSIRELRFCKDFCFYFWIWDFRRYSPESSWKFMHIFWHRGCTRALSKIWIKLWVTKDHLIFFLISFCFLGCERILHSQHCKLDMQVLRHLQDLLWALWGTLCYLEVAFLSKDVLQGCSMPEQDKVVSKIWSILSV